MSERQRYFVSVIVLPAACLGGILILGWLIDHGFGDLLERLPFCVGIVFLAYLVWGSAPDRIPLSEVQFRIMAILSSGPLHGYEISKRLREEPLGVGVLYPTLHRMEESGLLRTYTKQEDGRLRRYYELTETGIDAFLFHSR